MFSLFILFQFISFTSTRRELTASSEMLLWRSMNETIKGISTIEEAFILVQADWEDADSPLIPINLRKFTKRAAAGMESSSTLEGKSNIWYVPGGPGQSSKTLEVMLPMFLSGVPEGTTFYAFDHRGLGKSTPLANEKEQSLLEEYPKDETLLPQIVKRKQEKLGIITALTRTLRVENVARDLLKAVELVKKDLESNSTVNGKNYLVGVSYGTMVARRALQLSRDGTFESVLLDGLAPVENVELMNESDRIFHEICDLLPACKQRLDSLNLDNSTVDVPMIRRIIPKIIDEAGRGMNSCTAYFKETFVGKRKTLCFALHELMNATLLQGRTSIKVASLRLLFEMVSCRDVEAFKALFDTLNGIITSTHKSVNQLQSASVVASTVVNPFGSRIGDNKRALSSDELVFEVVSALERYNVTSSALNLCYNRHHLLNGDDGTSCSARLFDPCKFFQMSYKRRMALKEIYGELPPVSLKDAMVQVNKTRVLALAGNFDFNTPTWMSRQIARQWTRGTSVMYYEFFGYGHSMFGSSDCDRSILADFLDGADRTSECALRWNTNNIFKVNGFFNSTLSELNSMILLKK